MSPLTLLKLHKSHDLTSVWPGKVPIDELNNIGCSLQGAKPLPCAPRM